MDRPVLGIDTASRRGSLAIAGPTGAFADELIEGGRHAGGLVPAIDRLLARGGLAACDLGGIGVVAGPGSFTGLRIGLATAKGLGFSLGIAVEGMSTLEAIARALLGVSGAAGGGLLAVIEAGRGEVYAARFAVEGGGVRRLEPDRTFKPEALASSLPAGMLLAGDAAPRLVALAPGRLVSVAIPPLAPVVADWARSILPEGATYRPGGPAPNYVRPSDGDPPRRPA